MTVDQHCVIAAQRIAGFFAYDAVISADHAADAGRAATPGDGAGRRVGGIGPVRAQGDIVARIAVDIVDGIVVVQVIDIGTHIVVGLGADQAVGGGNDVAAALGRIVGQAARAAIDPRQRAGARGGAVVPVLILDQVAAGHRQRRDGPVLAVVGFQAQHAVGVGNRARQRPRAAAPGDGARVGQRAIVPKNAGNEIVAAIQLLAVAVVTGQQGRHAIHIVLGRAHAVVRDAADQAVGGRDGAHGGRTVAIAPGDGARAQRRAIAPVAAGGDEIAVR